MSLNTCYMSDMDRREMLKLLLSFIAPDNIGIDAPKEITDKMIEEVVDRRSRLRFDYLFGRPLFIDEVQNTLDLRRYLEYVNRPDYVMKQIREKLRDHTGLSPL